MTEVKKSRVRVNGKCDKTFTLVMEQSGTEFTYVVKAKDVDDTLVYSIDQAKFKPDDIKKAELKFDEFLKEYKNEIVAGISAGKTASVTTTTKSGNKVYLPKHLVDSITSKENVLMVSNSGAGKTHSVLTLFAEMKDKKQIDEVVEITFSSGMDDYDLLSKFIPDEEGKIKSIDGQLVKAFELAKSGKKVAVLLDELSRIPAKSLNILIGVLDKVRNEYRLENFVKGELIKAPIENLFFVGTANIGGRYEGTFTLDEALLDRFEKMCHLDYSDVLETELIKGKFSGISIDNLNIIKADVEMLRQALNQNLIESPFSTRMLKNILNRMNAPSQKEFRRILLEVALYRLLPKKPDGTPIMENLDLIFGVKK